MKKMNADYLLSSDEEKDRQQLQSLFWESDAEAMLDQIGVRVGWKCIDLGCGAIGILGLLARWVGIQGRIVGVDFDESHLKVAQTYLEQENLNFVELRQADVTNSGYQSNMFDLVHSRFLLPFIDKPESLLNEMIRLAKPGGTIALEESDHSSWKFYPLCPEWGRLLRVCEDTFALKSDLNMGRKTFYMLRKAGLKDVKVRASVKALQDEHPYMRMVLTGVEAIRNRAVDTGITTDEELDKLVQAVEQCVSDPNRIQITFTLIQVWGQKAK
jgi:SAM-dependent methyltransferase